MGNKMYVRTPMPDYAWHGATYVDLPDHLEYFRKHVPAYQLGEVVMVYLNMLQLSGFMTTPLSSSLRVFELPGRIVAIHNMDYACLQVLDAMARCDLSSCPVQHRLVVAAIRRYRPALYDTAQRQISDVIGPWATLR